MVSVEENWAIDIGGVMCHYRGYIDLAPVVLSIVVIYQ